MKNEMKCKWCVHFLPCSPTLGTCYLMQSEVEMPMKENILFKVGDNLPTTVYEKRPESFVGVDFGCVHFKMDDNQLFNATMEIHQLSNDESSEDDDYIMDILTDRL